MDTSNQSSDKSKIITRLGQLEAERATWWGQWQELTVFLLPFNGRFFVQDHNRGWRRTTNIFDNEATRANRVLAAGLMGGLTSPARPWFRLGVPDPDMMRYGPVKEWLSVVTRLMLDIFAKSNTYRSLHSQYEELGAFGTSAVLVGEDYRNVIHHFPITMGQFSLAQDWKGNICTMYRRFERTVVEVVKEFGLENVSSATRSMYERGSLDKWITIIHAIEPREDRDPSQRDSRNMPWRSVYYEQASNTDKPLRESGFKRFQVLAPRWAVAGGDVYGNSPGMEALGDIKQLQQEQLRKSQGIDYMTNPPLQAPNSLKNRDVERLPGGITYRDSGGVNDKIESMWDVPLDLSHLLADIQDVRGRIRSSFYTDMFLMLQNDSADTRKTATEVAELHEEKMLMLGPVLERLHNELLTPLIDITFEKMMAAGIVPPPPPELQGQDLNIELVSILAQAQRAIATNGVDRFVGALGQMARFKPDVLDKLDSDYWADSYSDMLGIDPELIVANDKVAIIRQQRAQQAQQQQQMEMANQAANTANQLGKTPTQGGSSNALDDVMSQFSGYTT